MTWTNDIAGLIAKRKELWNRNMRRGYEEARHEDVLYREAVADRITQDTPDGERLREELRGSPEKLIELVMIIVNKDGMEQPFFLNSHQRFLEDTLNRAVVDFREGRRVHLRFLLLKSRQLGFTAYISARQLAYSVLTHNFWGLTLADTGDSTDVIFSSKAKYPYNNLPKRLKPKEKYNTRKELLFEHLNSRWRVATAAGVSLGRGQTLTFWHGSEVAYWNKLREVIAAVNPAMARGTMVIFESTANGENEFKELWDAGDFATNLFFEWWLADEYRTKFPDDTSEAEFWFEVDRARGALESKQDAPWIWARMVLLLDMGLDVEQCYWYYQQYLVYGEKTPQEYPCSPEEAFLASGRPVFSREHLIARKIEIEEESKQLAKVGKLRYREGYFNVAWNNPDVRDILTSVAFVPATQGYVRIYEQPKDEVPYVIGGDTKGDGSDFFAASVIDNTTGVQVAALHGRVSDDVFAHQVYALGMHYNWAMVNVETNFNTYPISELVRLKYPYIARRMQYDNTVKQFMERYGFRTDGNTRPLLIAKMGVHIREFPQTLNDAVLISECLTFSYDDKGRPDAPSGKHDDLLFAHMIALETRTQQTHESVRTKSTHTVDKLAVRLGIDNMVDFDEHKKRKYKRGG